MKNLYPYIKPFKITLALSILLKATSTIAELFIPYLMSYVIDVGIKNQDIRLIVILCGMMLLLTFSSLVLTVGAHKLAVKGGQRIGKHLRDALFSQIQNLTIHDIDQLTTASLITRVTNDVEHIQRTTMMTCRMMVRWPLIMIGGTVMSLLLDPYLTCVMFGGMLVLFGVSMIGFKFTRPIYRKVKKNVDIMTGILRENLGGIRVIKAFSKIEEEVRRLDTQSKHVKAFELQAGRVNSCIGPTATLLVNLTIVVILYVGGVRVDNGLLEIGKIVTILNYINMILGSMMIIPRMFMMFSHASISAKRIGEVLELKSHTEYGIEVVPYKEKSVLEFQGVSLKYPNAKNDALRDISFKLHKGQTMAVVGTTGAGKTSLLQLILRLYDPTQGKIIFQGREISTYDKDYLREKISAAMQQYNIFSMSIGDNIVLDQGYDNKKLEETIESAQIRDLIDELGEHFDYKISQNGNNLSGGQKQRISIARTLYRQADLVVLDDVSSALDYQTDLKLRQALREKYKDQTVILISQRISSVKHADNILVLENGRCMGFGKHEVLIVECESYRQMCDAQERKEVKVV